MKKNLLAKIIKKDRERPRLKKGFLGPKTIITEIYFNIVIYWYLSKVIYWFTIKINELLGIKVN